MLYLLSKARHPCAHARRGHPHDCNHAYSKSILGCTAAGDSIANCWAKTCYGQAPSATDEEKGMTAPSPAASQVEDEEPRTPAPVVRVNALIHEHGQVPLTI